MRVYGLIGYPLTHSFSPEFFKTKFEREGIQDAVYHAFPLTSINALPALLSAQPNLSGLNVTIPYKEQVLPILHARDAVVEAVGACNCIHIKDGSLIGYNTDVIGFRESLRPHLLPHHQSALILGTGGAAKAVAYALQQLNINYRFVSSQQKGGALQYVDISASILASHTVIINTTPLGMFPHTAEKPALPYHLLNASHLLYDLIYNPAETAFMKAGIQQGATVVNGLSMLQLQAEESWKIWNG